jgi:hypothetical protein
MGISADAAKALFASHPTIQNVYDYVYGKLNGHGFTVATTLPDRTTYTGAKLDTVTGTTCVGATVSLRSVLDRCVTYLNANASGLVVASEFGTSGGSPSNTPGTDYYYLAGGTDDDAGAIGTEWEKAFAVARTLNVTAIWAQTNDAAKYAYGGTHVSAMDDVNERFLFLGAAANETIAQLATRVLALNNRYVSLWFQKPTLPFGGVSTTFDEPYMLAAMAAGMFCGRPIGRPLMRKAPRLTAVSQNTAIDLVDDLDQIIQAGLCVVAPNQKQSNQLQIVRDVTTYMAADIPQFTSLSASESVSASKKDLREYLDPIIGSESWEGTEATVKAYASSRLRKQATKGDALWCIKSFRNLVVDDLGTVYLVTCECEAIEGVTWIVVNQYVSRFQDTE